MITVHIDEKQAKKKLVEELTYLLEPNTKPIAIVCIGTDRATGDCVGPLVGYHLSKRKKLPIALFGTLTHPVHAKNLDKLNLEGYFVIAVDAALAAHDKVGEITIKRGAIKPGSGVGKNLMQVGNIAISGVVNFASFGNLTILQNTRLNIVMQLSEMIASVIALSLKEHYENQLQCACSLAK